MKFTVIGERINTSRIAVRDAVAARDAAYIVEDVKRQEAAGAAYIDVNAGARLGHETEDMEWLLATIQSAVSVPVCLDSPDPRLLELAFALVSREPLVNSISLERERYEAMLPFLKGKECGVIALCMDDTGLPQSSDQVVERAISLAGALEGIGVPRDKIHIDPLIQPIGTDATKGYMALEAVRGINQQLPGIRTTCGLSNISFGLPQRKFINQAFLALLMGAGLTGAIIDPLDDRMMATVKTVDMLFGRDEYCADFLSAVRAGQIV